MEEERISPSTFETLKLLMCAKTGLTHPFNSPKFEEDSAEGIVRMLENKKAFVLNPGLSLILETMSEDQRLCVMYKEYDQFLNYIDRVRLENLFPIIGT